MVVPEMKNPQLSLVNKVAFLDHVALSCLNKQNRLYDAILFFVSDCGTTFLTCISMDLERLHCYADVSLVETVCHVYCHRW